MSAAGLAPVLGLAEQAGLSQSLSAMTVAPPNSVVKSRTLIAGMLAGADSIDDFDLLRAGATPKLIGCRPGREICGQPGLAGVRDHRVQSCSGCRPGCGNGVGPNAVPVEENHCYPGTGGQNGQTPDYSSPAIVAVAGPVVAVMGEGIEPVKGDYVHARCRPAGPDEEAVSGSTRQVGWSIGVPADDHRSTTLTVALQKAPDGGSGFKPRGSTQILQEYPAGVEG